MVLKEDEVTNAKALIKQDEESNTMVLTKQVDLTKAVVLKQSEVTVYLPLIEEINAMMLTE